LALGSPSNLRFVQGFQGKEGMRWGMPQPTPTEVGTNGTVGTFGWQFFFAPNIVIFSY